MGSKHFYITTTLPYVNAEPHIGFAMEIIRADAIARYKRLQGYEVFFNTGTDEHGAKIAKTAAERGIMPQEHVDEYSTKFRELLNTLHISEDIHFTRTTDEGHKKAAQEFWKICDANGYIDKKNYQIKYCVGCELEKTESELVEGCCPIHPNTPIELIDEENYFFKFSAFEKQLLDFYAEHKDFIFPEGRFNEAISFVKHGLSDFSISRVKSKMPWGVEVPGDPEQVMYVWFDALVNYISALGWPENTKAFETFWTKGTPVQYCGKDNLRQQAVMWQAMLMAADLPRSAHIIVNGFITGAGGIKMSKSLGNTVNPNDLVAEYGTDALRYYLLREVSSFEDSPFTLEHFKEAYNANLANGLGNLVSRVMTMAETYGFDVKDNTDDDPINAQVFLKGIDSFNVKESMDDIWQFIQTCDEYIQKEQPFKLIKTDPEKAKEVMTELLLSVKSIGFALKPLLPETAEKILALVKANKKPETPLFLRKE